MASGYAFLLAASLLLTVPGSAEAAEPLVKLTLSASPNPAAPFSTQTFTGTVSPVSGTPTNVRLSMEQTPGGFVNASCTPAAYCDVASVAGSWVFPTLTKPVTITLTAAARSGGTATLFLVSDGVGCSGECPPSVTTVAPTVTATTEVVSAGQVVAGTVLHVTAVATANAGPINGRLTLDLPDGVDAPTGLDPDTSYESYHAVTKLVTVNRRATFTFDVVINAANGSTLSFGSRFTSEGGGTIDRSTAFNLKVGPDGTAPTATAPKLVLASGREVVAGKIPVRVSWTGSDAQSGITRYELAQSVDGGSWTIISTNLRTSLLDMALSASRTYRLRVRGVDHAGNVGAWAYGPTLTLTRYTEASSRIAYAGTWRTASSTVYLGGQTRYASTLGARATFTFTGRSFSWVARRGPDRGKAEVFVNGTKVATVDLYASSYQNQRVAWAASWAGATPRTITIRVLGTFGRPRVDLDALAILR